jgi:phenol 2-monooxygenase
MHDFPAPSLFPKFDYHKIYADCEPYHGRSWAFSMLAWAEKPSTGGHGRAYENYGIDEQRGAVIVVRPDGCKFFCSLTLMLRAKSLLHC